ncbi:B12-binding domain-containing protein [Nocardioides zhouii]|uniref:MerR family DNA-binding transcriptional regulator n=1 Tax=Nocardioides zhouii TaxID=1168729 RepID=A0A4Q2T7D6_9ACTN|nr:B12-binding domain-containing protein [Nocardioides zhouii]RYC14865.1 MerR family DNA-binding transcriptional regulator [Nocardioides zhouii]
MGQLEVCIDDEEGQMTGCESATLVPNGARTTGAAVGLRMHEASSLLGVPAPTLRSWELRYGLPRTLRSPGGHRRYTVEALTELGLMRDEIATGRPPSEAARRVRTLLDEQNPARPMIDAIMVGSDDHDPDAIRRILEESVASLGLAATLDNVVLPSMRLIGSWWESGRCDIGQEHFTTEVMRGWLARTTTLAPPSTSDRWVILATGPGDMHTVGVESLAALLVTRGTGCRILGAGTSQRILVAAVAATSAPAVVVVSHLSTQRRSAIESIRALAATGCPTFYAGNAFLAPMSRKGVPGSYLGERITDAAAIIERCLSGGRPPVLANAV